MKKLIALLSVPIIALVTACTPKAPAEEEYFTGTAPINMWGHANAQIRDFDKDGIADAILDENNNALMYAPGYEKEARINGRSVLMTPEVIKYSSDFIDADNNLRYFAAKADYERIKALQDTTGVEK